MRGEQGEKIGVEDPLKDRAVLTSDSDGIVAEQRVAVFISAGVNTRVVVGDVVDVQCLVAQPRAVTREHDAAIFLPRDRHQEVGCITLKVQRVPHGHHIVL